MGATFSPPLSPADAFRAALPEALARSLVRATELRAPRRRLLPTGRVDLEKRLPGAAVAAFVLTAVPDAPRRGRIYRDLEKGDWFADGVYD